MKSFSILGQKFMERLFKKFKLNGLHRDRPPAFAISDLRERHSQAKFPFSPTKFMKIIFTII